MQNLRFYFYMNTNINEDFQICISILWCLALFRFSWVIAGKQKTKHFTKKLFTTGWSVGSIKVYWQLIKQLGKHTKGRLLPVDVHVS